jgi:hypothetical protein
MEHHNKPFNFNTRTELEKETLFYFIIGLSNFITKCALTLVAKKKKRKLQRSYDWHEPFI